MSDGDPLGATLVGDNVSKDDKRGKMGLICLKGGVILEELKKI